ncbi:cytochrome P450 [Flammula alnicola]|nr:cytochrome P450 [Flammula alnicola]
MFATTHLALLASGLLVVYAYAFRKRDLDHIPTVGYSDPILSWISSIRYVLGGKDIFEKGYRLHPRRAFKIPMIDGWLVVFNGSQYVDDIRRASDGKLNGFKSTSTFFQFDLTLGPAITNNPYHSTVIRTSLTRNIGPRFQEIYEEVVSAYSDGIADNGEEWVAIPAFDFQVDVICKVSSRYFVGQPLCEDAGFRSLCERATLEIYKGRVIRLFPIPLRPLASRVFTGTHGLRAKMEGLLKPIIEHRLEQERLYGSDWPDKPNDLISWLMDGAKAANEKITVADISSRMLFVSFGAIHTSSITFTAALYALCLKPQDAKDLREEVQTIVKEEGWTKDAFSKMHRLDSFFRESQRMHFMSSLSGGRTALVDFTFSDGLSVPKGTSIAINVCGRHYDEENYADPDVFDAFRYVREQAEDQPLVTSPTLEYHSFGHGRAACPGRFFAMTELKIMMAHIVTNYDVKLEKDEYPPKMYMEANAIPSRSAKVLFRKRID